MNAPAQANSAVQNPDLLGVPRAAAAEIVVFFAAALVFDAVLLDGARFAGIEPHPFWLFVLVVAAFYGTAAGVFAAVLATLLAFLGNLPARNPLENESLYLLAVIGKPALWLGSAVVIGEIRTRRERVCEAHRLHAEQLQGQTAALATANAELEQSCDRLRKAAAGQIQTALSLVQAARSVETRSPSSVFASVEGLVTSILMPTAYSIYLHNGDRLDLVVQTNDGKSPNALGHYNGDSELYRAIVKEQLVLHVADPRGLQVLGHEGVMAGPLMDIDTGIVVGMLKVEGLPMTLLRQDMLQAFKALCEWIGAAYRNAQRYEEANQSRMVHNDSQLYTDAYYRDVSAFVLSLAARARFEVSQLTVRVTHDAVRKTGPLSAARPLTDVVRRAVSKGLRVTDLAFDYQQERGEFLILLPMTPAEHGQAVADRIRELMRTHLAEIGHAARVSVTFETLYVPTADDVKPWHRPILRRVAPS